LIVPSTKELKDAVEQKIALKENVATTESTRLLHNTQSVI